MFKQTGVIDAVLQLQIKSPRQQQIVQMGPQKQNILKFEAGGHQAEVHI